MSYTGVLPLANVAVVLGVFVFLLLLVLVPLAIAFASQLVAVIATDYKPGDRR